MKYLEILRAKYDALFTERKTLIAESDAIVERGETEDRTPTDDEVSAIKEKRARIAAIDAELDELEPEIADLEKVAARTQKAASAPTFIRKPDAPTPTEVRTLSRSETKDAALRLLEDRDAVAHLDNADNVRAHIERQIRTQRVTPGYGKFDGVDIAKRLLLTENDDYRSAFLKGISSASPVFTPEEARAVLEFRAASLSDASGGYGVPVLIDPTIILSSQGSLNPFRKVSRVIPITTDEWKGVSSAGVTWSIDSEAAAVSDDTPTLAQPIVTTGMARGFIPYSIEIGQDYPNFAAEMSVLLVEGYDELTAGHFATGTTGSNNRGIITALDADSATEVTPTTDGAFGGVDISKVWAALPDRFKSNASWMMNHDVGGEVSGFSSNGHGSFYTVDLTQDNPPQLKGRPVYYSSYFPDFTGTTGTANILVVGDFRNFVIVDRAGMNIELVPHLFDVTDNRPTGSRGWFAWARFGSNAVVNRAFRLLQNAA